MTCQFRAGTTPGRTTRPTTSRRCDGGAEYLRESFMSQASFDTELDSGQWLSVAELARMKSLSRQSAHERVRRLVETGAPTIRGDGRSLRVNLAQYDLAIGSTGDAAREAGAATKAMID